MLQNCSLNHGLDLGFGWPGGKPGRGVGKIILKAKISKLPKPGLAGRTCRGEDDSSSPGQDIVAFVQPAEQSEQNDNICPKNVNF